MYSIKKVKKKLFLSRIIARVGRIFLTGWIRRAKFYNIFSYRTISGSWSVVQRKKGKLGAYAMKRVAVGAHLPTPQVFEPAKRPDDRASQTLEPTTA